MEINRAALKKQARTALRGIYWFLFLACILASLVGARGGTSLGGISSIMSATGPGSDTVTNEDNVVEEFNNREYGFDFSVAVDELIDEIETNGFGSVVVIGFMITLVFMLIFVLAFRILISGPAEVCFAKTKLEAVYNRSTDARNFISGFVNDYTKNVKTMFVKNLYLWLWSLPTMLVVPPMLYTVYLYAVGREQMGSLMFLLTMTAAIVLSIPMVIKQYQYLLTPYIVAENSAIGAREAIRLSGEMMRGFKWQTFVLKLSFIGWYLLGSLCCLGYMFVEPYYQATETILYSELKAYHNGNTSGGDDSSQAIDTEIVQ